MSGAEGRGDSKLLDGIAAFARNNWARFIKFLSTGFVAFLFSEVVIYIGLIIAGKANIVTIDVVAAATSIALGFFLNDAWTTRNAGYHPKGTRITAIRLIAYEGVYALGNVIAYSIQLFLLYEYQVNPLLGNLVGAIVATPFNYLVTMKLIWRIKLLHEA
ncbi:MAG: GtrA family protein [Candidatus Thermoplasmatota archaeon]|nr:GtrA family protein [Candidatus Thermoplasmatota archaeon]